MVDCQFCYEITYVFLKNHCAVQIDAIKFTRLMNILKRIIGGILKN